MTPRYRISVIAISRPVIGSNRPDAGKNAKTSGEKSFRSQRCDINPLIDFSHPILTQHIQEVLL